MLASDVRLPSAYPGRGRRRFLSNPCTVAVHSAVKYCEGLIFLLCRDYDSPYESYWLAMLSYMSEYLEDTELLDQINLQEDYRKF